MIKKVINHINIFVVESYDDMSAVAASIVLNHVMKNPRSILGLATGSSPEGMYAKMREAHAHGIDMKGVTSFNLDEYYPIKQKHPQSYFSFMQEQLFKRVNIQPENIHFLNGEAENPEQECERYEKDLADIGTIDIQILGIGNNGHIAFNEPGSPLDCKTHLVNLTESTIKANSRFFKSADEVPRQALTMGLSTILKAKQILLLASGAKKALAIKQSLENEVTENVPASVLQTHGNTTYIIDTEAAEQLA